MAVASRRRDTHWLATSMEHRITKALTRNLPVENVSTRSNPASDIPT